MAFSCLVTWYMQQKVVGRGKKQEQYYIVILNIYSLGGLINIAIGDRQSSGTGNNTQSFLDVNN